MSKIRSNDAEVYVAMLPLACVAMCGYTSFHSKDVALRGIISSKWKKETMLLQARQLHADHARPQSWLGLGVWGQ